MNDDLEMNLDTQRRRLRELDELVSATLSDSDSSVPSTHYPRDQSYGELTAFNDALRSEREWTERDVHALLIDDDLASWRAKSRIEWTVSDYLVVGAVGVVGFMFAWFDSAIDAGVRNRLKNMSGLPMVKNWEGAGKRLPVDYMGTGFGGRGHRVKSAGHDLARPLEAIRQVVDGEFRGVRWHEGRRIDVVVNDGFTADLNVQEAALRLVQHLMADVITPMSLPIPGMSFLAESDSTVLREFALHAYGGLRAGEGWNVRSGLVLPVSGTVATDVLIRTYVHCAARDELGTLVLDARYERKLHELLLAAHGLVSAISLGKMTAQIAANYFTGNYLRAFHPAQIRHANLPSLVRTGMCAAVVVGDLKASQNGRDVPSWHELVESTESREDDLIRRFEASSTAFEVESSGVGP